MKKTVALDIECSLQVDIPATLECNLYDMNIILSNLFDNAVEAASATTEKTMNLTIKYSKGVLLIKLENSHHGKLKKVNGVYVSSKADSKLHGYGLKNVLNIAQKYHGTLEATHDSNRFYTTIILYI